MTKKTIYLIPLILLSFWMIPEQIKALTIIGQTDATDYRTANSVDQKLGTGITGTLVSMSFYASTTIGYSLDAYLICYDDTGYSDFCSTAIVSDGVNQTSVNGPTFYTFTMPTYTFDPTKYYRLSFWSFSASTDFRYYGCDNDCSTIPDADFTGGSGSLNHIYFTINNDELSNTNTRIISITNPTPNDTETSENVNFQFQYYYNSVTGGYTHAGINITNILTNFQYIPQENTIITSGVTNTNILMNLDDNSCFSWKPYLRGASTTIYGETTLFETNSGCDDFQNTVGDTSTTSFFAFLNVPNSLRHKSPVGYIYIMADILNNFSNITASSSVDLSLNLASSSAGYFTGTLDLFSADTIETYLNAAMTNLLRNFMVVITYITTGMTLFALGRKTFT